MSKACICSGLPPLWLTLSPLEPETRDRGVRGIGHKVLMLIGGANSAQQLQDVASILCDGLSRRITELENTLQDELRAMPMDELYAAGEADREQGARLMESEYQRREVAKVARESDATGLD